MNMYRSSGLWEEAYQVREESLLHLACTVRRGYILPSSPVSGDLILNWPQYV